MLVKPEIAHRRWHAGASVAHIVPMFLVKERLAMTSFLEISEKVRKYFSFSKQFTIQTDHFQEASATFGLK